MPSKRYEIRLSDVLFIAFPDAHKSELAEAPSQADDSGSMAYDFPPVVRFLRDAIPALEAVYHFGSSASGEAMSASDVDLAFLADQPMDPIRRFALAGSVARLLGCEVDLVDLWGADSVLLAQVVGCGRLIYSANPARIADFETTALAQYCLLNEERRELLADIQARGTIYAG